MYYVLIFTLFYWGKDIELMYVGEPRAHGIMGYYEQVTSNVEPHRFLSETECLGFLAAETARITRELDLVREAQKIQERLEFKGTCHLSR